MTDANGATAPRRPVVFWGATGQALVLRECVAHAGFDLVALFDNDRGVSSPCPGVDIHHGVEGFRAWLAGWTGERPAFLVAVAGARGAARCELHAMMTSAGLAPIEARHPTAWVAADAKLGEGCQILAQTAVCVGVRMGRCCIVNTSASVDHECSLGDGVHIAPGAHLAGCVDVGDYAMVGAGATVLPRLHIGAGAMVGAGAVVTKDVAAGAVVSGCPARPHRVGA